jgi:hypothetical protein
LNNIPKFGNFYACVHIWQVTSVRIEASNDCDHFTYVLETPIPADNIITFPTAIQAPML